MIKVLNLYAGIGGNRKLWKDVEVTAIEKNPHIAGIYKDLFPNDTVLVDDAHQFLIENFHSFDFIWSSPPCPTHSRVRAMSVKAKRTIPKYPDMTLYQEIIFLQHIVNYFNKNFVVENVLPYYEPLIPAQRKIGNHLFWANFSIDEIKENNLKGRNIEFGTIKELQESRDIDISNYKLPGLRRTQILRNCVIPQLGKHILNLVIKTYDFRF